LEDKPKNTKEDIKKIVDNFVTICQENNKSVKLLFEVNITSGGISSMFVDQKEKII
jgi:hypothetical protein